MLVNTIPKIHSFTSSKIYILSSNITIFWVFQLPSYDTSKTMPGLELSNSDASSMIKLYPFGEMSIQDENGNIRKYVSSTSMLNYDATLLTFNITDFALKVRKNGTNIPLTLTQNTIVKNTEWKLNVVNVDIVGGENVCYVNALAIYGNDISTKISSIEQQLKTRWNI